MAAGIIQTTVTTTTGETVEMSFWVDDTVSPTKYIPLSLLAASATAALDVNTGTRGAGTLRVTQATDDHDLGSGTGGSKTQRVIIDSSQLGADPMIADDAAFTPATSKVLPVGFTADESSTDSVDEGDAGAARITLDRKLITTPYPHTAGGLSIFRSIDLDETEEAVKASAGQVYGMWVTNTATSTRFLKFYNDTVANVSVGTTAPVITIAIPGNSSDDVSGLLMSAHGIVFDTAITVAATTGVADNDTGAPGANEVIVNIFYK